MSPTRLAGLMDVRGVLGTVVQNLGCRIVAEEWRSGEALPTEAALMAELQVGRSVVREAIRILNAKGLVRSRPMDGTRVMSRNEWRLLDPDLIQWRIEAADRKTLFFDLLNVRLALEPGVAWWATARGDEAARSRIHATWRLKQAALQEGDSPQLQRDRFIAADLEFHRAFLAAMHSEILVQLFSIIEAALRLTIDVQMQARGSVTTLVGMEESNDMHATLYDAFTRGDAEAAQSAMRTLIEKAIADAQVGMRLVS